MNKIENDISFDIRKCAFKIHNKLGPGLFESVYESALSYELKQIGHVVKNQFPVPLIYGNKNFETGFKLDLLVDDLVVVEVKSVEKLNNVHFKQLLSYIKLINVKLGLLINFNSSSLLNKKSIIRIANNL
ncbi:MAG: hypothetical protein HGGPFJEG_02844 [Ignavibacteria bacterium]|nr:hypothetical protein [Ignavibacteria bacterium]